MPDKVQKIRQEIERRIKEGSSKNDISEGALALESLLNFIDSLPEEPKCIYNRTLDERKKFCKYCSAACDVRIEEEPASEDLEEVIKNYIQKEYPDGMGFPNVPKIARHFAEWQKQKAMQDLLEKAEKFFKNELYVSISDQVCSHNNFTSMSNFIEQFKNYMQDEM